MIACSYFSFKSRAIVETDDMIVDDPALSLCGIWSISQITILLYTEYCIMLLKSKVLSPEHRAGRTGRTDES